MYKYIILTYFLVNNLYVNATLDWNDVQSSFHENSQRRFQRNGREDFAGKTIEFPSSYFTMKLETTRKFDAM